MGEDELDNAEDLLFSGQFSVVEVSCLRKHTSTEFFRPQSCRHNYTTSPIVTGMLNAALVVLGLEFGFLPSKAVLLPFLTGILAAPIRHLKWCVSAVLGISIIKSLEQG